MKNNKYTVTELATAFDPPFTRQAILKHISVGNIPSKKKGRDHVIDIDDIVVKEFIKNSNRKFTEKSVKVTESKPPVLKKSVKAKVKKTAKKEKPVKVTKEKNTSLAIKNLKGGRFFKGKLRSKILERDGYKCKLCGKTPEDGIRLEVDHIIEFEDGGETTYDNGQTICSECNKGKSAAKKVNDKDEIISITEFAKRVGVHRNNVAEKVKDGIIVADKVTGKINYTTEILKWFKRSEVNNKPVKDIPPPEDTEDELPKDIYDRLDSGETLTNTEIIKLPKGWVDKIKVYEQTKQIVQKRQQERKELLNKKLLRVTLGKLFEIHVNEFLTIKAKVVPDLAGIFQSTDSEKMIEAEKRLDEEFWKVLNHIKIEFNRFLKRAEDEPIS